MLPGNRERSLDSNVIACKCFLNQHRRDRNFDLRLATETPPEDLLALDEALEQLAHVDPRKAELVRLRFFVGLSVEEVAEVLDVSLATVARDWKFVRTWLFQRLRDGAEEK